MVNKRIFCHADLQDLQLRSDRRMFLKLVSLESVRIATDSYALLRTLVERKYWRCPQIDLLLFVATVAFELLNLSSLLEEATLGKGLPEALVIMKNSGMVLERLGKEAKKHLGEDAFLAKVEAVGGVLKCNADHVLKGTHDFAWFQSCLPGLLEGIGVLLSTQVYFPDY
ncbi:unnamed protein product [Urochloa decumbens]|uniref:Uncharacterized protein n=1 Tax=Urochloa decumbens TaxID=240449 RepID=A0ABC9F8F1_9POAL